jgi:hypothetical protein
VLCDLRGRAIMQRWLAGGAEQLGSRSASSTQPVDPGSAGKPGEIANSWLACQSGSQPWMIPQQPQARSSRRGGANNRSSAMAPVGFWGKVGLDQVWHRDEELSLLHVGLGRDVRQKVGCPVLVPSLLEVASAGDVLEAHLFQESFRVVPADWNHVQVEDRIRRLHGQAR